MDPELIQFASLSRSIVYDAGITNVNDVDSLTITLLASSVDSEALIELGYDGGLRSAALRAQKHLVIPDDDFVRAFGCFSKGFKLSPSREMIQLSMKPEFISLTTRMESALATTLSEGAQKKLWKDNIVVRAAAIIAIHRESDCTECLSSVLGGVVISDVRMIEELRTELEDEQINLQLVMDTVTSMSTSIVR